MRPGGGIQFRGLLSLLVALLLLLGFVTVLPAAGTPEDGFPRNGDEIEVTGRLRRLGSEPFTELVVTPQGGPDWYIPRDRSEIFAGFLQRVITVRGRVSRRELVLADGQRIGVRYELLDAALVPERSPPGR